MKRLVAAIGMAAGLAAGATTVAETRLTSPRAAQLGQGTIEVCANAQFTSKFGVVVDPGACVTVNVVNGAFSVDLEPTPAGIKYTATWQMDGGRPRSEQWFVPDSTTPLRLRDVQMGTQVIADAWRGAWESTRTYDAYDKVSYGGSSWIAVASARGVIPGTDETRWQLLARGTQAGSVQPTCDATFRGAIWVTLAGLGGGDTAQVCLKAADETYAWTALIGGGGGGGGGGPVSWASMTSGQWAGLTSSQWAALVN